MARRRSPIIDLRTRQGQTDRTTILSAAGCGLLMLLGRSGEKPAAGVELSILHGELLLLSGSATSAGTYKPARLLRAPNASERAADRQGSRAEPVR